MSESPELGGIGLGESTALEDAKAFNKGKGKLLAGMIGIVLFALAAFAWYLVQDQPNPYSELGKQVNGFRTQYFEGFWTCALPGKRLAELKSDADLRSELHTRGTAGARYGSYLRSKCAAPLRDLSTNLRALLPPQDAAPNITGMAEAATKMEVGANAYAGYLENLDGAYDQASAETEMDGLVRGWYEFRKAHAELNQLIKDKLGR